MAPDIIRLPDGDYWEESGLGGHRFSLKKGMDPGWQAWHAGDEKHLRNVAKQLNTTLKDLRERLDKGEKIHFETLNKP